MKNSFVAIVLSIFSLNSFSETQLQDLNELENKMTKQAENIAKLFVRQKINTESVFYQDIWVAEFNIINSVEIIRNLVFLSDKIEYKDAGEKRRVGRIIHLMGNFCASSQLHLKYAKFESNNKEVSAAISIQSEYAKKICDSIDGLSELYYKNTEEKDSN